MLHTTNNGLGGAMQRGEEQTVVFQKPFFKGAKALHSKFPLTQIGQVMMHICESDDRLHFSICPIALSWRHLQSRLPVYQIIERLMKFLNLYFKS